MALAAELRRLAARLRSGETPRRALMCWPEGAEPRLREGLARVARRLRLGGDVQSALAGLGAELGPRAENVALLFAIQSRCGGDLAALVEMAAAGLEEEARARAAARAASAGALLSGRMVAALPLLCLPLLPESRAPLLDPLGVTMLTCGVALALGGLTWIRKLQPAPPRGADPVATVAELLAVLLAAGVGSTAALANLAASAPQELASSFRQAARRVALGSSWGEALAAAPDPGLRELGRLMLRGEGLGIPLAGALRSLASEIRTRHKHAFEEASRKAPVLMVVPLVVCVLPSFLLLGLGPFLRGLFAG